MRPLSLRISPPTRSLSVVAALAIFCLLAAPAHAVSYFDWYYSTGTGGCWQTGTISSPSYQCNNVGAGYVASNMIGNGGQYDSTLTTSGDYCNEYGMELFNEPISDDLSQWTGFTTPTPHSSYTVGSGYGGICEASGDTWGQMAVSDSQNECSGAVCGVHHFASLGGLSGSDRPFAAAFGDPTLRVQGHFDAGGYRGSAGGWAYLCPILKDMSIPTGRTTSVGNTIELCVEEWLPSPDSTGWPQHDYVQCNSNFLNGHPFDTVITTLQSGMRFATPDAASHTTVTNGALGDNLYAADFTASNLQNVITAINSQCTGQSYSSTLADYGLLGIEQGEEEWRNEYILGGSEAALYATTMH